MPIRTVFIDTSLSTYKSIATQYDATAFNVVLLNNASSHAEQIQSWMKSNGVNAADINIVSASTSVNGSFTPRVVFVDSAIADLNTVIAGVPANATVVVLDASRDGVQQIRDYLAANGGQVGAIDIVTDLASVDVVSHGAPGEVMLGSTVLNASNLAQYSSQLAEIGSHLTAGADLLLYGCDVASGTVGQQFITALANATGADVAASTDLTGSAAAGGDWTLEASTGAIETTALNIAGYDGALDAATSITSPIVLSADTGVSSSDFITKTVSQTFTGTFGASTNNSQAPTIYVSTDGTGTSRTAATVTYTDNAGSGTFSVTANLATGTGRSIQFWSGSSGNNPISSSRTYTLDTTAPTTAVSSVKFSNDTGASASDFITNTAAQTISGNLSANMVAGDVVRVSLDNGVSWQTASTTVGQNTFSLSGVTLQGSSTLIVQVEDAAGNAGPARSQAYVLDTDAPTGNLSFTGLSDSGVSGDGITNDRSFNLALTSNDPGASIVFEVSVNGGAFTSTSVAQTNLADGSYLFRARVTDVAGNTTTTGTAGVTIDATAPNAPKITGFADNTGSASDTTTKDNTPTLTITAEADAKVEVFKGGVSVGTATQTAPHSGVYTFTSGALADGSYSFTAVATDAADNHSVASTGQNIVVDTTLTAPTAALTLDSGTAGDGLTNNAGLTFNTADTDATRVIKVDGTVVNSYDPKALTDGAHTVEVTDTDAAGNTGSKSLSFTLDTTAPAPTAALTKDSGSNDKDGITNDASLTLGTLEDKATRVIKVDGNVVTAYDASKLADGHHTVIVTDTDAAGNTASVTSEFTLDTKLTAPTAALAVDSGTAGDALTNNASLNFNSADTDATRVIKVDGNVVTAYDASKLADGHHTVIVTDTDGAGNTASVTSEFTLDTKLTAPTAKLTVDSGADGDGVTNKAGLTLNTADGDATRVIKVDGNVVTAYDASALADGHHTVIVTDTDGAGNTASVTSEFTLDTKLTAPTAKLAVDSGTDGDGVTNKADLLINKADDDATRVIKVDGNVVTAYDASALTDGHHTVIVTDTDAAGNTASVTSEFTLDTKLTAPTAALAVDSGTAGDALTNNASLNFNSADTDATRVIKVDGNVVTAYDASKLADGHHTVIVTDTDGAGNTASVTSEFTLDTKLTAPTAALALDSGTDGDGLTNKADLVINKADDDATRVIKVDGNVVTAYDASKLADGHHTVIVTDTDGAGNTASVTSEFTLDTKLTAPTAALTLDSGTAGDGLTNNAGLSFNTADGDATRVIKVDGNVVTAYDASKLADGHHTVIVTDTDGAGNTASVTSEFTLDTKLTAPTAALTLDSGTAGDGLTNNAGLSFNTADGDATRVIKVDGNVVTAYDASKLTDGKHTVVVTDTDAAGNTASVTSEFTLDTKLTAPTAALTLDSGTAGDGLTNNAGLTFNAADDDATRVIKVDGNVVTAYDASKLADGKHTVIVTDTDGAGNTASVTSEFTLDTKLTAPTAALAVDSGTAGDGLTNNAGLSFNTADGDATRVIKVDGNVVTAYDASKLEDGHHTVIVTDTDGAGNTASVTSEFTLDTKLTAPTASLAVDSGTAGDALTNDASLNFNTADTDATRVIKVDGNVVTAYDASKLADGHHTVIVTDTDGAGNTASVTSEFTLDTKLTAPTAALAVDSGTAGDSLTNDASLNFNTADGDATRVIKVDGTVVDKYDAAKLADGKHTVVVTDTDAAGNTASVTSEFTLDTKLTAPTAALNLDSGTAGDGLTNNASLTFNTADGDATRIIKVDGTVVEKYDASKLEDGKHTVIVTDTDAAGNTASVTSEFTLDTKLTAPTAALTVDSGTAGDGLTNNAGLSFNTADGDATRVIKVDGNVVTAYDASKLADGHHTVIVTDTDAAGNTASVTSEFTLDTKLTAPTAALTVDSGTAGDGLTNNAGLTFNTADGDATRVIKVDGNVVDKYDASKLTDGKHTVVVTDTDAAGNTASVTSEFTLDTKLTAPTAALTLDSGTAGDGLTNNAGLTFNAADDDATRVIKVDGNVVTAYDASKLADGHHTVIVTDTDGAGNTASVTSEFTLDTKLTAPTAALAVDSGAAGDGLTNNAGLNFNKADDDATRVIKVDGNVVTAYDASKLADGHHTVIVTDTDGAGNTASVTSEFTLDTKLTAPTAALTVDSGTAGDALTNDASLNFNTADSDATRVIKVDGTVVDKYDASKLADGKHTVIVTDTDAAGNTASVTSEFTLDTKLTAPTAVLAVDSGTAGDGLTNDAGLNFNKADDDATRVIKVDGNVVTAYDASKLADGHHTVIVTDTDAAGNTAAVTSEFTLDTKLTAPTAALAVDSGTAGDSLTNNASLNFNTADTDATRVIKVDGNVVTAYDASKLADGHHTVIVTDTDGAGNTASVTSEFTLDTKLTAPTVVLAVDSGTAGDALTNDASLNFNTADTDATRVIKVDGTVVDKYDASKLEEGKHTVIVTDTDAAGNTASVTSVFTLDTKLTAPTAALTLDSGTAGDGLTNNAGLTFNTADSDATRVIKVDGTVVDKYDASKLEDGKHTVVVTDTDAAGNTASVTSAFTLDTKLTAPTAALAVDSGTAGDGLTNNAGLNFNKADDDATRVIKVDGNVVTAYDASKLEDGKHTVVVTDTDAAGNTASVTSAFILDTKLTAPTAALTLDSGTAGDGLTNNAGLTFNTADGDATRVIKVDGNVVTAYDASKLADGHHTVVVTDTDAAGNTASVTSAFTLDTKLTAPTAALAVDSGTAGDGLTNNAALNFNKADDDATRVIKVDGNVVTAYDASKLADGKHTVIVSDTDAAGNTASVTANFELDTKLTAPTAALAIDSGTAGDGLTNKADLNLSTADGDATRVIKVDGNVVTAYDASKLADGKHTVIVTDTDAAGNTASVTSQFTLDTKLTAPTAALTVDSGTAGDGLTNDAGLSFNSVDTDATRVIKVDGTVVDKYDASKLADGKHVVIVTDTDAAGNTASATTNFELDRKLSAPTAALTLDSGTAGDGLTNNAGLTFNAVDADATRVIKVDGTVVGSYDASKLADGKHTVVVTDTDGAGNTASVTAQFTLDTKLTGPTAALTLDSGTAGDGLTNNASLSFNTADGDATRVIKVDGTVVDKYDASKLADGKHTVVVTDTDAAGNTASATTNFELDSKGPAFSSAASASVAENIGENKVVYKAVATDAHGVSYTLAGADAAKFAIAADGSVTLKANPDFETVNAYGFTVVATDTAGNHTDQAVTLGITNVNEAPVATAISKSTIENAQITFQLADNVSDVDAGDKMAFSLGSTTASLSWANTDATAPKTIVNPVTKAVVDISTLSVKASLAADGSVTLTPPAELDWMATGQALKATFSYTVTDAAGLKSQDSIDLIINGSTNDKGVNLSGGNGDDVMAGNATNNAEDVLMGNNGNDNLSGYGGTDALYGGNGDDKLSGGAGIDYLYGDNGNDTLDGGTEGDFIFGGKGNDLLTGGAGADKFVFAPQNGNDRITDFKLSEGDKLFFADFFSAPITVDAFLQKYVTDTGNDLQINLQGATLTVVGVANVSDLAGSIVFGMPA